MGYQGGGKVSDSGDKGGGGFNLLNPLSWFSGDAQKATRGELDLVEDNSLAGQLYNKRKKQEEMMKMLHGYQGGGRALSSGTDTVPAMLTPGEFVMSKGAVQKIGVSNLEKMNTSGGGTNKPKLLNNTMYAKSGGKVGGSGRNSSSNVVASKNKPWWQKGMDMVKGASASAVNGVRNAFTPKSKSKSKPPSNPTPKVEPKTSIMGGFVDMVTGAASKVKDTITNTITNTFAPKPKPPSNPTPKVEPKTPTIGPERPKEDFHRNLAKMLAMYESGNEGPRTEAYRDSHGIPTIGHGATWYPEGFRLKGNVKMGDSITEDEAIQIKEQHITHHREERLLKEIPPEVYYALPDNVKAGLESMVFNYGRLSKGHAELPAMVIKAQKEGNFKPVSDIFRNKLAGQDQGINDWRRNDEAQLIEKGFSSREGYPRINFETESTTTAPTIPSIETSKKLPDQAMISPKSRVTPPGPMQRSMTMAALPMGGGGSSGGKGGSSVGSNQKVAPSFSSTDPNDKHLPGVMSIYQITEVG